MSEPKLDIKIKASVEVAELRKLEESLQREIVQIRLAGTELDKLAAKEARLHDIRSKMKSIPMATRGNAAMQEAVQSIPGVGPLFLALSGSAALLGAGIGVVAKGFQIAGQSIRAFAASEVEMAKLDASLANSGKLTDEYRAKLERLAKARSGKTAIDDEKYLGVFTTLTKFGADSGNIEAYTAAVENLAGFIGGDLEQAAFLFGKAIQGSTEMLGRYGISVDKSKSQSEQLADIMRQLEVRGAGQLEAMANTLDGSFAKIKNSWENLLESFGSLAEKAGLANYFTRFSEGLQIIADKIGGESTPKQKNREEIIGATPEEQKAADEIALRRAALEKAKGQQLEWKAGAEDRLKVFSNGPLNLLSSDQLMEKERLHTMIGAADSNIERIDAALTALESEIVAFKQRQPLEQMLAGSREEIKNDDARNASLRRSFSEVQEKSKFDAMSPAEKVDDLQAKGIEQNKIFQDSQSTEEQKADAAKRMAEILAQQLALKKEIAAADSAGIAKMKAAALEASILEAKAAGDTAEVKRQEWIRDFEAAIEKGATGWDARRIANAKAADLPDKEKVTLPRTPAVNVSSMARLGGAVGESMGAAMVASILQQVSEQRRANDAIMKSEVHLKGIKAKISTRSTYG